MSHVPKLDLSRYDLLAAKDALFAYVCSTAKAWGMDPNIECHLFSPQQAYELESSRGRRWYVMWEAGPHGWGEDLSLGGVTFVPFDGPYDVATPDIILGEPYGW